MRLAVYSESPADEAALEVLVRAVLGDAVEFVKPAIGTRGWPSVRQGLTAVIRGLHYQHAADGLIVVVDSDEGPIHGAEHETADGSNPDCRHCMLAEIAARTRGDLKAIQEQSALRIAIGLAVPMIEAWYLCGRDATVTEAAWVQRSRRRPFLKASLKTRVYGEEMPRLEVLTQRAVEEAQRLAQDISVLEQDFQNGFGGLARQLRSWLPRE